QGTPLADSPAYKACFASLLKVSEGYALKAQVAKLANDPKVMLAASARGLDWYLQHPQAIREALRDPKIANALGTNLVHEINVAAIEAQQFAAEHGVVEPPPGNEVP